MKTVLFITATCTIAAPALSQSGQANDNFAFSQSSVTTNTISLMDSSFHYNNWNSTTNDWNSTLKYIYHYNALYVQDAESIYSRIGNTWKNTRNGINYVFDANNNMLERTYEQLVSGSWTDRSRETCTYDASNRLLTSLQEDKTPGFWINQNNIIYTYTGNKMASYTYQSWNTSTGAWDNMLRNTYTYNTNDQMTSVTQATWTAGAWVDYRRSINYVYTGTELTSYEAEIWNTTSSAYESSTKTSQTYDVNHDLLNSVTVKWNAATASWDNFLRIDYTHDTYGNIASLSYKDWNNTSGNWVNAHKSTYFHRTGYVGLNEHSAQGDPSFHPNPVVNQLIVSAGADQQAEILSLEGKLVITATLTKGINTIDLTDLPKGIYLIRFDGKTGRLIRE